jgi:hypothetical protein
MTLSRRSLKRIAFCLATVAAAWVVWGLSGLPPRATVGAPHAAPAGGPIIARGVYHAHSRESDGTGTVPEIALAAERAGLQFVVLTDHHDGSRPEHPPRYYGSVLVVEAAEISAAPGHYVALGLARSPYPLAGEPRDVVEDVRRLGGFGIAAHPDSPRESLRWLDWGADIDGMEWFNADSQWRAEPILSLARSIPQYPIRPSETVASMFLRPAHTLSRWDKLTEVKRVVGIAGSDAHARFGIGGGSDPYQGGLTVHAPSYEAVFRAMSLSVELDATFTRDAVVDAGRLIAAIRAGHLYAVIDGFRTPGWLSFEGRSGSARAREGDILPIRGLVHLRAECDMPAGSRMTLIRNGQPVRTTAESVLDWVVQGAENERPPGGTFRVEVQLAGHTGERAMPWIVSNPIYVGMNEPHPSPPGPPPAGQAVAPDALVATWRIEKDAMSQGSVGPSLSGSTVQQVFRFALGSSRSPFVAMATSQVDSLRIADRIVFTGRADRPLRISVQVRAPTPGDGDRWWRSVYLDTQPREVSVSVDDMRPIGATRALHPVRDRIDTLLFVIDSTNAGPGFSATVWLGDVRTVR